MTRCTDIFGGRNYHFAAFQSVRLPSVLLTIRGTGTVFITRLWREQVSFLHSRMSGSQSNLALVKTRPSQVSCICGGASVGGHSRAWRCSICAQALVAFRRGGGNFAERQRLAGSPGGRGRSMFGKCRAGAHDISR